MPAAIALENHPTDSRVKIAKDGKVQTLTSRCGTGGGNVPLVLDGVENSGKEVENSPAVTLKIRSGCEGGGKGAIWQEEKSATLGCNNDQTVFVPKCYGVCSKASHSMMSDTPTADSMKRKLPGRWIVAAVTRPVTRVGCVSANLLSAWIRVEASRTAR